MARTPTRRLITDAAVQVAARRGITGASMDEIAELAGVAKGSLYYNFSSKDAIFEEVIRGGFDRVAETVDAARAATLDASAAPRAIAVATLELLRDNLDLAKIIASEVFRTDRPWAESMEVARASVVVRYRDVLRAAVRARGGDPAGISEIAGAAFFGALAGACLDWLLFRPEQPIGAVVDQVLQVAG